MPFFLHQALLGIAFRQLPLANGPAYRYATASHQLTAPLQDALLGWLHGQFSLISVSKRQAKSALHRPGHAWLRYISECRKARHTLVSHLLSPFRARCSEPTPILPRSKSGHAFICNMALVSRQYTFSHHITRLYRMRMDSLDTPTQSSRGA